MSKDDKKSAKTADETPVKDATPKDNYGDRMRKKKSEKSDESVREKNKRKRK